MKVYGKEVTPEDSAAALDYIRRIGYVRQYQLGSFMHRTRGFDGPDGQGQECAGRLLQKFKKAGLVRYGICGWCLT